MTIANSLGAFVAHLLKPFAKKELEEIANTLEANKDLITQQANAGGLAGAAYVEQQIAEAVKKSPLLSLLDASLSPQVSAFLSQAVTQGTTSVPALIDQVVAFLRKEETYL